MAIIDYFLMRATVSKYMALVGIMLFMYMPLPAIAACDSVVTSNSDSGDNTLRAAITIANDCGSAPSTITFNQDMTIELDSEIELTNSVTINAVGHKVVLDGRGSTRIFYVNTSNLNLVFKSLTFTNGYHATYGGALFLDISGSNANITIQDSTFSQNNVDSNGGALNLFASSNTVIESSTFWQNSATDHGGAIRIYTGTLTISNSSFVENAAKAGSSLYIMSSANVHAQNTLFTNGSDAPSECYGDTLVTNDSNYAATTGCDMTGQGNLSLGTLADNGGDTQTVAIPSNSPLVEAGNNSTCLVADQRGLAWSDGDNTGGTVCDIGAYEYQYGVDNPTPYNTAPVASNLSVTIEQDYSLTDSLTATDADGDSLTFSLPSPNTNTLGTISEFDTNSGTFKYTPDPNTSGTDTFIYQVSDGLVNSATATVTITIKPCDFVVSSDQDSGENTLREAMTNLCSITDSTVTFSENMMITLDSEIIFTENVMLDGSGHTITLDGGGSNRIFYTNTNNLTVAFKRLNFINGMSSSGHGGAVRFNSGGTQLTVHNSTFLGNSSTSDGGALSLGSNSTTLIENTTFNQNSSNSIGGAISMHMGQLIVKNSYFEKNTAFYSGGALQLGNSSVVGHIENSTFNGNEAPDGEGGAINADGDLTVTNSTFYDNTAATTGGALYLVGSNNTIENSSFVSNSASAGNSVYNYSGVSTHVNNSLFANGTGNADTECDGENLSTNLNNLATTGGCGMLSTSNLGLNLGELADNGGNMLTVALQRGSPAIDAGDDATCVAVDQRGFSWIDGDGDGVVNCDIGAYAYQESSMPDAPSDLMVANLTDTFALVTWTAGLYTQQFYLFRSDWTDWVEQTDDFYTDNTIECSQVYTYQLTAKNAYGTTEPVSLEMATLPCAIDALTATPVSASAITLDWTDSSTTLSGYTVLRDDVPIAELAPDARSYTDLDLTCDTLYAYQLTQQTAEGEGNSVTVSATTETCTPFPMAPTDLTATTIEAESVTLAWTDNSDNETLFVLLRDGQTIAALNADSLNHKDSTVSCGQTYTYSVVARNDFGDSTASILTVTTTACPLEYTLTLSVSGQGTINGCGSSCQQVHPANTSITLTAEAAANWQFEAWSGACDANGQITLTANQTCTAHFVPVTVVTPNPTPTPQPTPAPPPPPLDNGEGTDSSTPPSPTTIKPGQSVTGGTLTGDTENAGIISNLEVATGSTVTGGQVSGTITNNGTLSDTTVNQYSTVNGGELGGTITNQGTLNDVNLLADSTVQGGELGGMIENQGTVLDVSLEAGSKVHGGTLGGTISGDADNPAYLGDVDILPGTVLENVHLSPTVQLPAEFVLGDNVTFAARPNNPTPQDFGIDPEQLATADATTLAELEPAAFSVLLPSDVAQLTPSALTGLDSAAVAQLPPTAVAALTPEQFNALSTDALAGLTAANLTGLTPQVIGQLSAEQVAALDVEAVQNSDAAAEILTNLDAEQIDEAVLLELVPETWSIEPETGRLLPAVGATLGFPSFVSIELPDNVTLPTFPDLSNAMVIGGQRSSDDSVDTGGSGSVPPSLDSSLKNSFTAADLVDFVLSQADTGVLLVEGIGAFAGIQLTFMPDNMVQADQEEEPVGVAQTEGGFYRMTTPEGYQFVMIPAPKNPLGLAELLGDTGSVQINLAGDVWLNPQPNSVRRNLQVHQVVMFDPFIEQAPPQQLPGIYADRVVYPNGIMQKFHPTFPLPAVFIAEALKIPGVQDVILTNEGSCKIVYDSTLIWAVPTGEVQRLPLSPGERVLPSVRRIPEGFLYTLQDNTDILQTYFVISRSSGKSTQ